MSIPEEPSIGDLPSSPSEAYALGFRHGWIDASLLAITRPSRVDGGCPPEGRRQAGSHEHTDREG